MALSQYEELIHRELQALAGDLTQVAKNITRDHEERAKDAEEIAKHRPKSMPMAMRGFDREGLDRDLTFIRNRLNLVMAYIEPEHRQGAERTR